MSFGQVFCIKFVLYLPKWASGDKNLCHTLQDGDESCGREWHFCSLNLPVEELPLCFVVVAEES